MRHHRIGLGLLIFIIILGTSLQSGAQAEAPQVIKTNPENGATVVDPALDVIRVEFDRPMMQGGFSWCGGGPNFPEFRERPRWVSETVCEVPVRLKPNWSYSLSINCPSAQNFRSANGIPVKPYPIQFKTGAGTGESAVTTVPRVIKTIPENGETNVDPTLDVIRVEFDQPMMQGGYSWCGGGPNYPETTGKPSWVSETVCELPVRLKPNWKFALSVNCPSAKNFRSVQGIPVDPYQIVFTTGAAVESEAEPSESTALDIAPKPLPANPQVVKATPDNVDIRVDPKLEVIQVEFDRPMSQRGFSWCGGGSNYPELRDQPRWVSETVCELPVRLRSDWEYYLSVNCPSFKNFRDTKGNPADPYPIHFKTGDGILKPELLTRRQNQRALQELRKAVDERYSYRDLRGVDWDNLFREYTPRLENAQTASEFARLTSKLLANAQDIHISLTIDDFRLGTTSRAVPPNANPRILPQLIPNLKQHNRNVWTGTLEDGITYIAINSWSVENPADYDPAFAAITEAEEEKGMIIDVRLNSGGDEPLAQTIAGCFIDLPKIYAKQVYCDPQSPSGFTPVYERSIEPTVGKPHFGGKVAVLTGYYVMSSCEAFLMMMRQAPQATLIGERSYGSSGNPKPVDLSIGITLLLPSWRSMQADGTEFEGKGIAPDVEIKTNPNDFNSDDPVLKAALQWLREG